MASTQATFGSRRIAASSSSAGSTMNNSARTMMLPASRTSGCRQGFTRGAFPPDSSGIASRRTGVLRIAGIPASQPVHNFLEELPVRRQHIGNEPDQHDLEADDNQYGRQDQRLHVPDAVAREVEVEEPESRQHAQRDEERAQGHENAQRPVHRVRAHDGYR